MKWILIISLFSDGYYSGAASASFAGEFESQSACLAAGNEWIKQMRDAEKRSQTQALSITPKALCVRTAQ